MKGQNMKTFKYICIAALTLTMGSCYDMDLEPKGIIGENVLLTSDNGIKKYFAVTYQDLPIEDFNYNQTGSDGNGKGYATVNQDGWHTGNKWTAQKGSPASAALEALGRGTSYGDGWGYWPYDRIRDINNFIAVFPNYRGSYSTEEEYNSYLGEAHFLRAFYYFGMVKRYGGVPIVKEVLSPTAGDALLQPRNTEYECWKFIYEDLKFAMENAAGRSKYEPGRANRYAAAALMSRAMLYAGCAAKYGSYINVSGPAVSSGLMSIPADKAEEFFQYAYDACKFIQEGGYTLHGAGAADAAAKEKAYVEVFLNDNKEDEDIFVKQYTAMADAIWDTSLFHCWDGMVLPLSMIGGGAAGAALQPAWELMKLYEMPAIIDADGKPVRFNSPEELWNNGEMEPRCRANFYFTGMTEPGSGKKADIQAGVYTEYPGTAADGTAEIGGSRNDYTDRYRIRAQRAGESRNIGGKMVRVSGQDGLGEGLGDEGYTRSGAFIRKYTDPSAAAASRVLFGSKQPWKVFRYGEVLCNWAEAAYELGTLRNDNNLKKEAFVYVNQIRSRAGAHPHEMVTNPEDIGTSLYGFAIDENLKYIRDERARELCFENQRLFDLRRWRVADIDFLNGKFGHTLLPYYVLNEDKWIYLNEVETIARTVTFERRWYYEQIPGGEIGKNPNLVRNDGY